MEVNTIQRTKAPVFRLYIVNDYEAIIIIVTSLGAIGTNCYDLCIVESCAENNNYYKIYYDY